LGFKSCPIIFLIFWAIKNQIWLPIARCSIFYISKLVNLVLWSQHDYYLFDRFNFYRKNGYGMTNSAAVFKRGIQFFRNWCCKNPVSKITKIFINYAIISRVKSYVNRCGIVIIVGAGNFLRLIIRSLMPLRLV